MPQKKSIFCITITNTAIINLVKTNEHLLLTDDFKLVSYLENQNFDVINFNHTRPLN